MEVTRRLGCLQEHVDSSGAYDAIPLASTLDIKSKDRTDGLQYRAGLHYVRLLSTLRHAFPCQRGQAEATVPVLCPGTLHEQSNPPQFLVRKGMTLRWVRKLELEGWS